MAAHKIFGGLSLLGGTGRAVQAVLYTSGAWPARPTDPNIWVLWVGPSNVAAPADFVDGDGRLRYDP